MSGALVQMDDFVVTLRDASGDVRGRSGATPGLKVVKNDPLAGASRAARSHHRQEHPRRRRLSGDPEMKRLVCVDWRLLLSAAALAAQGGPGLDPAKLLNPGTDSWPTLQRRLLGPPLQHADEDQRDQRQGAEPRLGATV